MVVRYKDTEHNKCLFMSDDGVVSFKGVELYDDMLLLTGKCGRGKTHYATSLDADGMLAQINKELEVPILPHEMLVLEPRVAILAQQLSAEGSNLVEADSDEYMHRSNFDTRGKIKALGAHKFGNMLAEGKVLYPPKLVVIDETHTVVSETGFAEQLYPLTRWLEDSAKDIIKIGLTATPDFLLDNVSRYSKMNFNVIDKPLGSKYEAKQIHAITGITVGSLVETMKFTRDNKALVLVRSSTEAVRLSRRLKNAAFLVSTHNTDIDKQTGKQLNVLMDEKRYDGLPLRKYIEKYKRFPDDVDVVFITSAYREGINIQDSNIKRVVAEGTDMLTIEQILGRLRQELEELWVVSNGRYTGDLKNKRARMEEFIAEVEGAENEIERENAFKRQLQLQNGSDGEKYAYVNADTGEYEVNRFEMAYIEYQTNFINVLARKPYAKYETLKGEKLFNSREYFINELQGYSNNDIKFHSGVKYVADRKAEGKVGAFDMSAWLGRNLFAEDKKELANLMAIEDNKREVVGWSTVKKRLIEVGYRVEEKRVRNKRVSVIFAA